MDEPTNVLARLELHMGHKGYRATREGTETTRIFREPAGCFGGWISAPPGVAFTAVREGGGRTRLSVSVGTPKHLKISEEIVLQELGGTRVD